MFDPGAAVRRYRPAQATRYSVGALLVLGAILVTTAAMAQSDFDSQLAKAAEKGLPALLKVEADWCVDCLAFDEDYRESSTFAAKVDSKVLLVSIDAEKGSGVRLAETYRVDKYPTFILTDAAGRTMDRWYGYRSPDYFMERLNAVLEDPLPTERRRRRFAASPSEADAYKLGEIALMEGYYGEAIAYFRQAGRLGGNEEMYYSEVIMRAMISGTYEHVFDLEQVVAEAEPLLSDSDIDDYRRFQLNSGIARLAHYLENAVVAREYFRRAVEETQNTDDPKVLKMRHRLMPNYALLVEEDPTAAIRHLEAGLPSDWKNDARELNNVAWWCFKNQEHLEKEHLEEAERLARRGVELSAAGNARANVLDTLAELCNLRGNCDEALELIREALGEDPQNEYFQRQAVRFEEILAEQQQD